MHSRSLLGMALMLAVGWSAPVQADVKPVDEKKDKPAESNPWLRPRRERPGERAPKVGEVPPWFRLKLLGSKKVVSPDSFAGKKPLLLFFGSWT